MKPECCTDAVGAPGLEAAYGVWRASGIGRLTYEIERGLILELIGDVNGARFSMSAAATATWPRRSPGAARL